MLKKDRMKRLAGSSPEFWSSYKQLRNQVTKDMRLAVSNCYHGWIKGNTGDPKKMWKTINKVLEKGANSTRLTNIEIKGKIVTCERSVWESLNNHFVTIGPKFAERIEAKLDHDCLKHIGK